MGKKQKYVSRFRKTNCIDGFIPEIVDDLKFPTMIMTIENSETSDDVFLIYAYYDDPINRKIHLSVNLG